MAVKSQYTRFLIDEHDFSGDSNSLELSLSTDQIDVTAFQDSARQYIGATSGGTLTQGGYFGTGTDAVETEVYARLGTGSATIAGLFGTDTAACPAYVLPETEANEFAVTAPVGGVVAMNSTWVEGSGIKRGIRIFSGTISATGTQTAVDLASAGSAGGVMYLFVQTITGSATDATIDVESSATEGGTYASEGTATFSAVGSETVAMTGTVNRWLRLNCTSLGGATSFVVVAVACVSGVTY
jgi:hypothetical protein